MSSKSRSQQDATYHRRIHRGCNLRQERGIWQCRTDKDWHHSIRRRRGYAPTPGTRPRPSNKSSGIRPPTLSYSANAQEPARRPQLFCKRSTEPTLIGSAFVAPPSNLVTQPTATDIPYFTTRELLGLGGRRRWRRKARGVAVRNPAKAYSRGATCWSVSVFTVIDGLVFTVFDGLWVRRREELAGCREAVGASSRCAAPSLRYGPSGDPPPSTRRSAAMAVSKLPATGRSLDAGLRWGAGGQCFPFPFPCLPRGWRRKRHRETGLAGVCRRAVASRFPQPHRQGGIRLQGLAPRGARASASGERP